jgi:hypothetical protein
MYYPEKIFLRSNDILTFYDETTDNIITYDPLKLLIDEWSNNLPLVVHNSDVKENNEYRHPYCEMGIVIYNLETGKRMKILNPHFEYVRMKNNL